MGTFWTENIQLDRAGGHMPRPVNRWRVLGAAAAVCILIVAADGCGKKTVGPDPGGDEIPFRYLPRTSPQNVLQNLISAYTRRDSVETAVVYDATYLGTSTAPSAPTPVSTFTRADEIRHVGVLKLSNNIVSLFVDLGSRASWQRLPANANDPADWAVIPILMSTIRIEDISSFTTWETSNQLMEFTFQPSVAAPGDTTWTVVRWTEVAN